MISLVIYLMLILLTSLITYNFFENMVKHWKSKLRLMGIPLPLIGHMHLIFGSPEMFYKKIQKLSLGKSSCSTIFGPLYVAILTDVEIVTNLFKSENKFKSKSSFYDFVDITGKKNIFTATGKTYRDSKKVLLAAVSSSSLKQYMKTFNECSRMFLKDVRPKTGSKEVNLDSDILLCVFSNILGTVMGMEQEEFIMTREEVIKLGDHIKKFMENLTIRMYSFWLHSNFIYKFTKYHKQQKKAVSEILETLRQIILTRRKKYDSGSTHNETTTVFIDKYFEMTKEDGSNFTIDDIIDDVTSLFLAGIETTEVALGSAINLLAMHKDVQEKVQKECDEMNVEEIDLENVEKLTYLDRVISEVMRLYPPVPFIGRKLQEDIDMVNDGHLDNGAEFVVSIDGIHKDSTLYSDPLTFNPDNFLPEKVNSRPALSYIPFGVGSRKCFGGKFSNLFVKTFLYHFFKNYNVHTNKTEEDFRLAFGITAKNRIGVPIFLTSRKSL